MLTREIVVEVFTRELNAPHEALLSVPRLGWYRSVRGGLGRPGGGPEACLGNGASFSSCRALFIDSVVRQGEGPGPEYGTSAWVEPYVRSAAKV